MLSFQELYEESQEQVQDTSAATTTLIKRAINQGAKKFGAVLSREWRTSEKTFSTVADQQYYQMPEDAIRLRWVTVTVGSVTYPLTEVADDVTWQQLNMRTETSDVPEFFYVRGSDEFGIWPIPASASASGGRISYERRMRDMSQDDYTAGTVAVTNGSAAVVGTSTTFTAQMVGRYLKLNDPNGDGMWYKVASFTDATNITLENTYAGSTASTQNYKLAEMPDIPEEFHESLIDYACYRVYRRRRDVGMARDMKSAFDEALTQCKMDYSSKTGTQYFRPLRPGRGYIYQYRDYKVQ